MITTIVNNEKSKVRNFETVNDGLNVDLSSGDMVEVNILQILRPLYEDVEAETQGKQEMSSINIGKKI